jgi:hypothetical protein
VVGEAERGGPAQAEAGGNGTGPATGVALVEAAEPPAETAPRRPAVEHVPQKPAELHETPAQVGDVVCPQCSAGNAAHLHFCRRCGTTLGGAPVVERTWWQRLTRRPRRPVAAGRRRGWAARRHRLPASRRELLRRLLVVLCVLVALVLVAALAAWAWTEHVDERASSSPPSSPFPSGTCGRARTGRASAPAPPSTGTRTRSGRRDGCGAATARGSS